MYTRYSRHELETNYKTATLFIYQKGNPAVTSVPFLVRLSTGSAYSEQN